jgi:hypothetical protein
MERKHNSIKRGKGGRGKQFSQIDSVPQLTLIQKSGSHELKAEQRLKTTAGWKQHFRVKQESGRL